MMFGDEMDHSSKRDTTTEQGDSAETDRRQPSAGAHEGEATATRERPATVAEFTAERMLRPRPVPPSGGLGLLLYRISNGLIQLGVSSSELEERELIARAKTPVSDSHRIVVISRKGGVGKTTTALMLGHTFATYRGDRVVVLDGNPDAGSLGYRIRGETTATITDLLRDREVIERYADIRAYTSQFSTRLEVIASDDDLRISKPMRSEDYREVVSLLEKHYNLILLDTATGVLDSVTRGFISIADQIVLVTQPGLDSARVAAQTLDWLDEHGHSELVKGGVTAINGVVTRRGLVDLDLVEEHFQRRCRAVVRIPRDPILQSGAETSLSELRPPTQRAYLALAAAVADGFGPRWWTAPKPQA
jgi:putative peptide zinc metalloprotease protein